MISLIFMVLILAYRPLATEGLNSTQSGALLSNLLTLFVGIMLIVTADLEDAAIRAGEDFDSSQRDIISSLIFIANMLVMAIPGVKVLSDGRVMDNAVAMIADQFCNKIEKQKMAEMMTLRDRLSEARATQSAVSGVLPQAPGSPRPAAPRPAVLVESPAAPAALRGELSFALSGGSWQLHGGAAGADSGATPSHPMLDRSWA